MDLWINEDYADVFAVIAAWIGVLVPWNITYFSLPELGQYLYVRFPLFQVRYAFGSPLSKGILFKSAPGALMYQQGSSLFGEAYLAWVAGAVVFSIAVILSLGLYFYDDRLEEVPVDFSRIMGWVILVSAGLLTISTWYLMTPGIGSQGVIYIPIPLGMIGLYIIAGILLFVERRELPSKETESSGYQVGNGG
mgnify:CR=1 FL=1